MPKARRAARRGPLSPATSQPSPPHSAFCSIRTNARGAAAGAAKGGVSGCIAVSPVMASWRRGALEVADAPKRNAPLREHSRSGGAGRAGADGRSAGTDPVIDFCSRNNALCQGGTRRAVYPRAGAPSPAAGRKHRLLTASNARRVSPSVPERSGRHRKRAIFRPPIHRRTMPQQRRPARGASPSGRKSAKARRRRPGAPPSRTRPRVLGPTRRNRPRSAVCAPRAGCSSASHVFNTHSTQKQGGAATSAPAP